VLGYAVRVGLLADDPAKHVSNPEPKRRELQAFASLAQLEAVAAELSPAFGAVPVLAELTGLRPEEWIGLERGDVDREAGVSSSGVYTDGLVKLYGKQTGSLRTVPLGTPTRRSQSRPACRCSSSLAACGRASSRSTAPMGTCSPTRSSVLARRLTYSSPPERRGLYARALRLSRTGQRPENPRRCHEEDEESSEDERPVDSPESPVESDREKAHSDTGENGRNGGDRKRVSMHHLLLLQVIDPDHYSGGSPDGAA
jgi:hypothetical protein